MTCEECRRLLGAHLDRELDARSSVEVEEHLRGCAACRAELQRLSALQALVRERAPRHEVPPGLRRRLRPRASRAPWVAGAASLAAAAAIAIALLPGSDAGLGAALVDAHLRALQPGRAFDVASSDRHVVRPWFAGKVAYAVPGADLAADGFPLLGGRVDVVRGETVAALAYGHGSHVISVFVWPEPGGDEGPRPSGAVRGFTPVTWRAGGMRAWAVSDAAPAELEALARAWR